MEYEEVKKETAIRILYRYGGCYRSYKSARQYVEKRGVEKALREAEDEYGAVEKAKRHNEFVL